MMTTTVNEIVVTVVPVCDSDGQVLWTKSGDQCYQQVMTVALFDTENSCGVTKQLQMALHSLR